MASLPYVRKHSEELPLKIPPASLLLVSVLGSLVLAACSVILLGPEDRISIIRGTWLSALGLVFFVSLFDLLNHFALQTRMGQIFQKKYELTIVEVLDISNKTVSAVQALLSCITGSIVCIWSCTRNFLRSTHFMSEAYAWFGASYFFYDIWSMYMVHRTSHDGVHHSKRITRWNNYIKKQPMILLHHLFIGSFGFLVIVYLRGGLGDCVFGFVYLMELSTPFVSFRGILSKLKMKSSQLYVFNGLAMLVTFFFCRVVMFPYVCYLYSQLIGLPYWEVEEHEISLSTMANRIKLKDRYNTRIETESTHTLVRIGWTACNGFLLFTLIQIGLRTLLCFAHIASWQCRWVFSGSIHSEPSIRSG